MKMKGRSVLQKKNEEFGSIRKKRANEKKVIIK